MKISEKQAVAVDQMSRGGDQVFEIVLASYKQIPQCTTIKVFCQHRLNFHAFSELSNQTKSVLAAAILTRSPCSYWRKTNMFTCV
jgi:hypothetical protein